MFDHVPTQTISPRWLVESTSRRRSGCHCALRRCLTLTIVEISSPATTSGPHSNSCAPWTQTRVVDPELGIEEHRRDRPHCVDDREHRRSDDVRVARLAGGLDVEVQRIGLADRTRVLAHLLAPDRVCVAG